MDDSNGEHFKIIPKTIRRSIYNSNENKPKLTIQPQAVLDSVYAQIKRIQSADRSSNNKKDMKESKKSNFLTVNHLPVYQKVTNQTHSFDTQCVSDTQLVNIIEEAEAIINMHKGMTQEFEDAFTHNNSFVNTDNDSNTNADILDNVNNRDANKDEMDDTGVVCKTDINVGNNRLLQQSNVEQKSFNATHILNERDDMISNNTKCTQDNVPKKDCRNVDILKKICSYVEMKNENNKLCKEDIPISQLNTQNSCATVFEIRSVNREDKGIDVMIKNDQIVLNDSIDIEIDDFRSPSPVLKGKINLCKSKQATLNYFESLESNITVSQEKELYYSMDNIEEIPLSPVLQVKKDPTPMVVPLEDFERFEKNAFSIVNNNEGLETCKHMINSQILGGELCLNIDDIVKFNNKMVSPIIEKSVELFQDNENEKFLEIVKHTKDKGSDSLNDEILFSSDEENDNIYREFRDLPLTAALESSFNDHSNVLEKTMFVGFQTANNKCIQIDTESFQKAKRMLDDRNKDCSLTELVEICDDRKQTSKSPVKGDESTIVQTESEKDEVKDISVTVFENKRFGDDKNAIDAEIVSMNHYYDGFIGFKTASNKKIDLSDKAIDKSRKVFQDIEFDVNDLIGPVPETNKSKAKYQFDKKDINEVENGIDEKIIDDSLIQEFENIDMSLEEKTSDQVTHFEGFKTASNRNIKISNAAMEKMKNVFEDIDLGVIKEGEKSSSMKVLEMAVEDNVFQPVETLSKKTETSTSNVDSFKTVNNKKIVTSVQAFPKSKNICQKAVVLNDNDLQLVADRGYIGSTAKNCNPQTKSFAQSCASTARLGFKTANNKDIRISDMAFAKSKSIFKDIDHEDQNCNEQTHFEEFKTASNKDAKISQQALLKSRKIFQDIDYNKDLERKFTKDTKTVAIPGFLTAHNKFDTVSEESIQKSKAIMVDKKTYSTHKNQPCGIGIKSAIACGGFQTARNNPVSISKEALEKSKKLFDDVDLELEGSVNLGTEINDHIDIKYKKLFKESDENSFVGFKTASNTNVDISKEALAKCKKIFGDIEDLHLPTENNISKDSLTAFGFQTACDKKVGVSKEAIEKTKTLFSDTEIRPFEGFQTANKKKVSVSDEAFAKSKTLFQDIDNPDKKKCFSSVKVDKKFSFQTANSKKVDISQDALTKSRNLFDTKDRDIQTKPEQKHIIPDFDIDTQLLNNFEESLYTEDFKETPRSKRSGSPILSCPKAKKKKFETPYKVNDTAKRTKEAPTIVEIKPIFENILKFNDKYKTTKIYNLKDLKNFGNGKTLVDPYIFNFNLDNILDFEFGLERNEITDTKMDVQKLKEIFLNAVNKNLVPEGWPDNHLKLILWKLLSYEVKFPNLGYICTVKNVIDQLKYRYDKELFNVERPTLRKLFERDDVSTKTMILCVAGIYIDGVNVIRAINTPNIELLLTDGWYFIKATIDKMLAKLVYDRKIVVGCKIITAGAEIMNCEQGMAPWEDTSAVRLKLSGNSTRLAKWDSKLGYTRSTILCQLSSIRVDGGKISKTRFYVARVYPLLYVEKFEDGSTVTRSERQEHLHQIKCEGERELIMERIYEDVQREFSDQESQDSEVQEPGKRRCLDSGSQIAKMMKKSKDPMEFRAQLTSSQIQQLQDHTSKYRERLIQAIQTRVQEKVASRNVVTLARGRIAAKTSRDSVVTKGMLSIWKPNDAILDIFKEGSCLEVLNAVPTAMRYSEIQLTAGRQCLFRQIKCMESSSNLELLQRKCYELGDVAQNPAMTTDYNEIDTVGIVFLIDPDNREFEPSRNFQNVYIADADRNMICVIFWGGIKKFGFENILDTGQVVACANLQKRAGNTRKSIPQFRATEFSTFTKTPKNSQAREMAERINKKLFGLDRRRFCDDCIAIKNNYAAIRCLNNENESPYIINRSDYSFSRHKMFIETPLAQKKTDDVNLNLTGLDFESTFKQDTQLSPKTLLRKRKVNEKIVKLKMYGEPPPLSSISIINKSSNATSSYKSPLHKNNMKYSPTLPENNMANKNLPNCAESIILDESNVLDTDTNKSPVISMKRSYVKHVPVKLNFSNNVALDNSENVIDQFAEEFEGSPPLSLD